MITRRVVPTLLALGLLAQAGYPSLPAAASPAAVAALPPVEDVDGRAGACYSFYPDPLGGPGRPFVQMALDAGSRWDRFDFSWPVIEPHNDQWNFGPHDTLVNDLDAAGMNMVGILLWTPGWAASGGVTSLSVPRLDERPPGWYAPVLRTGANALEASAASSPPQGLYLPWNDPGNHWGNYVHTVVSRYGDRVKHWEMWNEPEWSYFWTGTSADYAQLLKVGYQATKAACPDCTVLFGGLHYWANPSYYRWVLSAISKDPIAPQSNYFFDVMSVHLYSRSSTIYDVVNSIRSGMTEFVSDHPIWLTETGVPVWNDSSVDPNPSEYDYAATQREAAAYLIQSYANAWASGVERYLFFRTHDGDLAEYFGLIRNDHSLRPAYAAFQVAATYLVSPTMATRVTYPGGVRRVTLWGTPGGKVSVLWNTMPEAASFSYPATLPTATVVDRRGITQTLTAQGGVYPLSLPGATANLVSDPNDYIIGGEPYLVIEADTIPPTSTLHSLPDTTYSDPFEVSWEGTDDAAGIWAYDVQVREGLGGPWTDWLVFATSTAALYSGGQHGATYCFRARAWDRAGNREEWPVEAQACTTLSLMREVHLHVGAVFGDEDADGAWGAEEAGLSAVAFRFVDAAGADVVTPSVGGSCEFTVTLRTGNYRLVAAPDGWPSPPPGWLPRLVPMAVEGGQGVYEVDFQEMGLFRHRASRYLPAVRRND
jgi:hypothetical protein